MHVHDDIKTIPEEITSDQRRPKAVRCIGSVRQEPTPADSLVKVDPLITSERIRPTPERWYRHIKENGVTLVGPISEKAEQQSVLRPGNALGELRHKLVQ